MNHQKNQEHDLHDPRSAAAGSAAADCGVRTRTAAPSTGLVFVIGLALCGALLLASIGGWDLWNPDEPRYAQIAREMVETGQYIVPHINGGLYPDKPPLFFWLIAGTAKIAGDATAFAARLPSVLAALGILALTYVLGRRLFDPLAALIAAGILFTSENFFTTAVSVHIDPLLTLLTTAAILLFHCGYRRFPGGAPFCYAAWVCMGLALLAKGPVGLCIPIIVCVLFLAAKKEWRSIGRLRFASGLLLAAGIMALWLVPACILGGEVYRDNILFKQTLDRTVDSYSHRQPFYYFLINFPIDFLPWSLFIPGACIYFWKNRARAGSIRLPLAWFAGVFLFFSMWSCKRSLYLLPLYPAAALLLAKFFADTVRTATAASPRVLTIPFGLLCGLLACCAILGAAVFAFGLEALQPVRHAAGTLYAVSAVLICGGMLGILLLRRSARPALMLGHVTMVTAVALFMLITLIFPAVNGIKSGRFFSERIRERVGPDDRLSAAFEPEMFNYFLHRYPIPFVQDDQALRRTILAPAKNYILMKKGKHNRLPEDLRANLSLLDRQTIGHQEYVLLVNIPGASPPAGTEQRSP